MHRDRFHLAAVPMHVDSRYIMRSGAEGGMLWEEKQTKGERNMRQVDPHAARQPRLVNGFHGSQRRWSCQAAHGGLCLNDASWLAFLIMDKRKGSTTFDFALPTCFQERPSNRGTSLACTPRSAELMHTLAHVHDLVALVSRSQVPPSSSSSKCRPTTTRGHSSWKSRHEGVSTARSISIHVARQSALPRRPPAQTNIGLSAPLGRTG